VTSKPAAQLREIENLRFRFDNEASLRKQELLDALASARLENAAQVLRLHEWLCFARAYPDDSVLLARVEKMLEGFDQRRDLRKQRKLLADSGIAGTSIHYEFYHQMAVWLTDRWPERLRIDWPNCDSADAIEKILPHLGLFNESPALDEQPFSAREWLERMKGPAESDAAFLVRRIARLKMDPFLRESFFEDLAVPMIIEPGPDVPSRTQAWTRIRPPHFQTSALRHGRPDLATELKRACPEIQSARPDMSGEVLDLSRAALVTRSRDLDAFAFGDERDVRLADCGDGLTIAFIGMVPERRLMFETVYGYLMLKNGVPLGYGVISALFHSVEVAFNVYDTFRGVEAGFIFSRLLTTLRHMFKARTFTLFPYQLGGQGNEEGLASGAWWFYQKLGFKPRDEDLLKLMDEELKRMRKNPGHRSKRSVLKKLASENVYYDVGKQRRDVIGELPFAAIGTHITAYLAGRFGSRRDRAAAVCGREAADILGVGRAFRLGADEKLAWDRWAPLVLILPGVAEWSRSEKRALAVVIKAKGGRRESDFTLKFDAHTKLRRSLLRLGARDI